MIGQMADKFALGAAVALPERMQRIDLAEVMRRPPAEFPRI